RCREPVRGAARDRHRARRPRREAGDAGAALATGEGWRGRHRAVVGRAGDRQIAPRPDPARWVAGEAHTSLGTFSSPHHQDHALYRAIAHLERAAGFWREGRVLASYASNFGT